jgi:hypothetical protein
MAMLCHVLLIDVLLNPWILISVSEFYAKKVCIILTVGSDAGKVYFEECPDCNG